MKNDELALDRELISSINREYWRVEAKGIFAVMERFEKIGVPVRAECSLSIREAEREIAKIEDGNHEFVRKAFACPKSKDFKLHPRYQEALAESKLAKRTLRLIHVDRSYEYEKEGYISHTTVMMIFRVACTNRCMVLVFQAGPKIEHGYACHDADGKELIEGTPIGTKQYVFAWAKKRFGKLKSEPGMVPAELFFSDEDRDEEVYVTTDGRQLIICKVNDLLD